MYMYHIYMYGCQIFLLLTVLKISFALKINGFVL